MLQIRKLKGGIAVVGALIAITSLSCSTSEVPKTTFTSVGRGAPLTPAIPADLWAQADDIEAFPFTEIKGYPEKHWLVGPFDPAASGNRLKEFFAPLAMAPHPTESSRSTLTSSRRRIFTPTVRCGLTSGISAATARTGSSRSGGAE